MYPMFWAAWHSLLAEAEQILSNIIQFIQSETNIRINETTPYGIKFVLLTQPKQLQFVLVGSLVTFTKVYFSPPWE